ncbi:MAG TPA: 3-oxoacyl-[acyl-carrier-protein] reductase [Blastocatellia bacterium]|jgi:3-oxoacyl-[acyl-carrier protein] reductase|nr:3-oxoacyl-[acyl-carrier-protein] reductase [Blastocatellia bacterium]
MTEFQGRVAIVTGGSRGIGRAIAKELASRGASVAFTYSKNRELADELVSEIEAGGGKASGYQADVTDAAAAERMVKEVKASFGSVDYLVNNAGVTRDKLIMMMSEEDWDAVLDTNLKGVFNVTKPVVSVMVRQKRGSILNISSISGLVGMAGQTNYSASKAGLIGFTKALAKEIARRNITVNALALGLIETDMTSALAGEYRQKMIEQIPLGRYGSVEEVAKISAFLLSDEARYITGQVIQADGGLAI